MAFSPVRSMRVDEGGDDEVRKGDRSSPSSTAAIITFLTASTIRPCDIPV
jgi:hypothetical protein